ncbi:hypothetical protein BH20ACT1_BH20ACT1_13030 [soil metagenome]
MVQADGNLRIVDLGLARGADQAPIFGGTPGYWSPEVRTRGAYSARSDLYSLAATTYFLFTGTHPSDDPDLAAMQRALAATPTARALPRFPDVILAGLAEDPDARPESVEAWVAELTGAGSSTVPPEGPLPPPAPTPSSRGVTSTSGGQWGLRWFAAVAVLLAVAGFLVVGRDGVPPEQADDTTTAPEGDERTPPTSTSSTSPTTTTPPPPGPVEAFLGVWHGESVGDDGSVSLALVVDQPGAVAPGDGVGRFGYGQCRGPLRLVRVDETSLTVTPVSSDPDCQFDGEATLARSGETASYDWSSEDGTSSRSGTFERSARITPGEDPGWPTDSNDAGSAFYAYLGACLAGPSPPCSESGQVPDWTSCSDMFCIAGGGSDVVDVHRDLDWVLELPASPPNTAVELLMVGFSEPEVVELLD